MPTARTVLAGTAAPCPDDVDGLKGTCVYALGGFFAPPNTFLNTVEAYSPATNTWATLPSMPTARASLAATTAPCPDDVDGLKGTCVYALGGRNATNGALNTVEAFSPATNTWKTLPSLPTGRSGLAAATAPCPEGVDGLKGKCVYAYGGGNALSTVEAFSPATNTWATLPSMPTGSVDMAGAAAPCPKHVKGLEGTCVYAAGGNGQTVTFLNTLQAYSPATNTWKTLPSMPTARSDLAGAAAPCPDVLEGACVYAVGGTPDFTRTLGTTETYSPASNIWATLPPMPTARQDLAAASAPCPDRLKGTCVYAFGGDNSSGDLHTLEAFRPQRPDSKDADGHARPETSKG
ncbi:Kelch repeat-containing protein [Kitasatospora sp. NPDC101235]|uniref:Kelch repeat-containing protein n=1 Tax=Kitasatospora sp. NPDC101235 TaxID=3364101 RepID=UPI0038097286